MPIHYFHLITEDGIGEYGTTFCYLLAGAPMAALAYGKGRGVRRFTWAGMVLVLLWIGFEEISWGQRILDLSVPELLR